MAASTNASRPMKSEKFITWVKCSYMVGIDFYLIVMKLIFGGYFLFVWIWFFKIFISIFFHFVAFVHMQYLFDRDCSSISCSIQTNLTGYTNHDNTVRWINSVELSSGVPFVRPMKNVTTTAGKNFSIRCYVAGYPVSEVTWSKGQLLSELTQSKSCLRYMAEILPIRCKTPNNRSIIKIVWN